MAQTKSKILKSKSSDSVLQISTNNSKRQSNAAFHFTHNRLKKGVYVKRKPTEVSSNDESNSSPQKEQIKAPRRPCLGTKPFLTSALKLLSKSTASTQYPDYNLQPKIMYAPTDEIENDATIFKDRTGDKQKKKKKYKSKILNNYNYGEDRIQVLQFKKALVTTPSLDNSGQEDEEDFDKIKWSEFLPRLVKPDEEEIKLEKEKNLSHLVKEVTEGRMSNERRDTDKEEPATLVSEQKDTRFYNFFVDLLETTFSVYNMKSKYKSPDLKSVVSSKVDFEIDKVVADKLKIGSNHQKEPKKYCCIDSKPPDWNDVSLNQVKGSKKLKKRQDSIEFLPQKRKRNRSQFGYNDRNASFSRSVPTMQKKSGNKKKEATKTLRQNLLNSIKEQLTKECSNYLFEEPTSLYQALKVMAKNKRKSQKTIKFDRSSLRNNEETRKRRNSSKIKPKFLEKGAKMTQKFTPQNDYDDYQNERPETTAGSNHSLIVYNYDEQKRRIRRRLTNPLPKPNNSYNNRKESYNMMQQVLMAVETLNRNRSRYTT